MESIDLAIYSNVIKFIKYRYDETVKEDKSSFKNGMTDGYYDITIKNKVSVIITSAIGRYANMQSDLKKLINDKIKVANIKECIVLLDMDLRSEKGSNNIKAMNKFTANFPPDVWVQMRPKTIFYLFIPNMVPPHKLVDKEKFLQEHSTYISSLDSMERIYEFDPPVTWIGGRAGNIVQVERPSIGTIKSSIIYKKVII